MDYDTLDAFSKVSVVAEPKKAYRKPAENELDDFNNDIAHFPSSYVM